MVGTGGPDKGRDLGNCVSLQFWFWFIYLPKATGAAEELMQKDNQDLPQYREELTGEDSAATGAKRGQATPLKRAVTKDWQRTTART